MAGAVLLVLLGGYGWWAVSLPPFSGTATAAILLAGGAATAWGAVMPRTRRTPVDVRSGAWAALAVAVGSWQLAAYLQHPRQDHPTLSSLANALLDSHPARAAAFVLWIVAAFALVRR